MAVTLNDTDPRVDAGEHAATYLSGISAGREQPALLPDDLLLLSGGALLLTPGVWRRPEGENLSDRAHLKSAAMFLGDQWKDIRTT